MKKKEMIVGVEFIGKMQDLTRMANKAQIKADEWKCKYLSLCKELSEMESYLGLVPKKNREKRLK